MNLILLAAGNGRRMKSNLPKVLHEICGRSMICRVLDITQKLKNLNTTIVVQKDHNLIKENINKNIDEKKVFHFAIQNEQLGTGDAVKSALDHLDNSLFTLILYGDVPLIEFKTIKLLCANLDSNSDVRILTANVIDPKGYGRVIRNKTKQIIKIIEEKDASGEERKIKEVFAGPLLIKTKVLKKIIRKLSRDNKQNESYLTDIVRFAAQQKLKVQSVNLKNEDEMIGVNDQSQKIYAEKIFKRRLIDFYQNKGLNIIDPERFDIRGELTFKKNVTIDIGCILTGKIKLGNNVLVGAYSNLKNVEAGDNVEIKPYCHIENSKLKKGSSIGPFARLRDQTTIGQNCRVGNFVEIKNSFLGFGTKASHLSYLGDAKIGKNVNIGAGAITCNYDGINKNITTIDDNVFIGSNSSLVAPIKIKQGATIGASSCITEDAPAKSLNVERNKQTTIKNWKKK